MPPSIIEGVSFGVTLLLLPFIFVIGCVLYVFKPQITRVYNYLFGAGGAASMDVAGRPVYRQADCAICLERIDLQVSGTCGHVFCGTQCNNPAKCLFEVFEASASRSLACPTCRKPITTILRVFEPHDPLTAGEKLYTDRINEYNYLHDDNRGILRCLIELPILWNHIKNALTNPRFFMYLVRNFGRYRILFFLVLYILSPLDILPEALLGFIGLLDDILICFIVLALVSQAVMAFVRNQA